MYIDRFHPLAPFISPSSLFSSPVVSVAYLSYVPLLQIKRPAPGLVEDRQSWPIFPPSFRLVSRVCEETVAPSRSF